MSDNTISILITSLNDGVSSLSSYGVLLSGKAVDKELSRLAQAHNRYKARGVSLKRPSPRMSRERIGYFRARAVYNLTRRKREYHEEANT